jgi:hypothetical protein
MSERDWKDQQRDVIKRLFEAAFERREASEGQIKPSGRGGDNLANHPIEAPPKGGHG